MKLKALALGSGILIVLAVAAFAVNRWMYAPPSAGRIGQPLLPDLDLSETSQIRIESNEHEVTLNSEDGTNWTVAEQHGFPVDTKKLKGLLFKLANERVADLKRYILANPYCRFWKDLKPTAESIIDFLVDWGDGPVGRVVLKGAGIKAANRGRHPKYVICDDILSDFSNPLSSTELRLINRIFRQTIMSLPSNPEDVLCLVGTPQSYNDILYQLAMDESWLWLLYPAVKDWAAHEVQWPEKYSYERLMRIRKSVKPDAFEVEYQLLPVTLTDQFLNREDLNQVVDIELRPWDLEEEFVNAGGLGIYGGMDVGKEVHPTHIVFTLELPSGTLITLYQTFMDHLSYPEQVKTVNHLTKVFGLTRGYYDATFNVLDDRGLNQRWIGRVFTRKLKGDLATGLEKRVFAEADRPGIVLLNDRRFLDQITMVRKNLTAVETPDGHADSFWSLALACRAADDGPSFLDMGSASMTRKEAYSPRSTAWAQVRGGVV